MKACVFLALILLGFGCRQAPRQTVTVGAAPVPSPPVSRLDRPTSQQREKKEDSRAGVSLAPVDTPVPEPAIAEGVPVPEIEAVTTRKMVIVNLAHSAGRPQSFVALEDGQDVYSGLASGAAGDVDCAPDHHPEEPHNHLGAFPVRYRETKWWSRSYDCWLNHALFYHNGHGHALHACQPNEVDKLGQPASHGCIRVSPEDAEWLFNWAGDDPVTIRVTRE